MQNSHQEWKTHHLSQGNSSCKEKRNSHFQTWKRCQSYYGTSPYKEMRKTWIQVHLHQGSTTLSRHPMLSTLTHPRRVPQNFQQLEMESSNMVALPCFNHNAEATTHKETPKNVHDKETLSTNLKMDANMDTNHMAHRYRHTEKEAHLLSEPSELQPLKAMAHQYRHTGKEAHLLSGPSELQPPEDSEAQKFRSSTQIQQPRQEYSRFTETEKAKFQIPSTYNDERKFVRHNSVDKFSPNLVYLTTPDTSSVSDYIFFRKKGGNSRGHSCTCRRCTCTTCTTCTCICTHTGDCSRVTTHSRNKKVNKELWKTSQRI